MKATSVEVSLHRVPLEPPWRDSRNRVTHIEIVLCEINTDTEHVGVGYSYTGGNGGGSAIPLIENDLAPLIVGENPAHIERLWHRMWNKCHDAGARGIAGLGLGAIDVALWDLVGKHAGKPLFELLGGARDSVEAYASGINLHLSQDELLDQVEGWLGKGYEAIKIKVGKEDPREDVDRVGAVRDLIGGRRRLMLDANQAWTASEAIYRTRMLEPFWPYWMEEPLISDDVLGHSRVRQALSTAIAIGENIHSKFEMATYIHSGAVDIVQADAIRMGGITEWLKVAHMADAFNLKVAPHFLLELSGSLLCGVPNVLILEDVEGGSLGELGLLEEMMTVEKGRWKPSHRPGHGILFSRDALENTKVHA
jgi:L-alanine-DL-glutamate epimerase-like enolase superfamily enzyme